MRISLHRLLRIGLVGVAWIVCFAGALAHAQSGDRVFLAATGTGVTEEKAQARAMQKLASLIFVDLQSTTSQSITQRRRGDSEFVEAKNAEDVSVTTSLFAQGIRFENAVTADGHEVTAILTEQAVLATLDALVFDVGQDPAGVEAAERLQGRSKAMQYLSLLEHPRTASIRPGVQAEIQQAQRALQRWENYTGNYGWVQFVLPPEIEAGAIAIDLSIDDQRIVFQRQIFLPPGAYRVRLAASNHNTVSGRIRIRRKTEERFRVNLIRIPPDIVAVSLRLDATLWAYQAHIESFLFDYRIANAESAGVASDTVIAFTTSEEYNDRIKNFPQKVISVHGTFLRAGVPVARATATKRLALDKHDAIPARQWKIVTEQAILKLLQDTH
ncbi:MAG: hypothetical protein K0U78_18545 [Actinomycetia bacterium]|nr:hypothetical protein [Actinomycetes bacterium]